MRGHPKCEGTNIRLNSHRLSNKLKPLTLGAYPGDKGEGLVGGNEAVGRGDGDEEELILMADSLGAAALQIADSRRAVVEMGKQHLGWTRLSVT
jgi:hypothetical protein